MSKTFAERMDEDRRLVILRILADSLGYKANSSVVCNLLDGYGHAVSRDYVKTQLAWLAEQQLLTIDDVGPILVAELTERGQDVARGRAVVPGVKRPGA